MPWATAAAAMSAKIEADFFSKYFKLLTEEPMSKFNWRTVDNNRITTKYEEIWLWDNELAVTIPWPTNGKQLRNMNPAFTHWMPKTGDVPPNDPVPMTAYHVSARSDAIIESHDDDCPF